MPCDHCFGLDDREGRTPATPELEQREDDLEHVAGNVPRSSLKFNWLNQYGFFGMDKWCCQAAMRSGNVPESSQRRSTRNAAVTNGVCQRGFTSRKTV
jgi:hypothetical protein